tara:strand:- start:1180 stop:2061 length:882 start_codon:yes stop_codon:yes gene_type:complete
MSNTLGWTWWSFMTLVSLFNVALLTRTLYRYHSYQKKSWTYRSIAAVIFTCVCGYRSILPRVDVPKLCWFNTPLNWIFFGRLAACFAELAWTYQFCSLLRTVGKSLRTSSIRGSTLTSVWYTLGNVVMTLAILAECCSWTNLITTNNLYAVYEQGLWSLMFLLLGGCFCVLLSKWAVNKENGGDDIQVADDARKKFQYKMLVVLLLGMGVEQGYESVGLYLPRYKNDQANHVVYNGTLIGLFSCKTVSKEIANWSGDVLWMVGYFSIAVWSSIWMAVAPLPHDHEVYLLESSV